MKIERAPAESGNVLQDSAKFETDSESCTPEGMKYITS